MAAQRFYAASSHLVCIISGEGQYVGLAACHEGPDGERHGLGHE
jgi:hypothetical protein